MPTSRRPSGGFQGRTAIAGVGYTPLTRHSGRSVLSLAVSACQAAMADAGLDPAEVDGVASFSLLNDSVPSQAVATSLGLPTLRYTLDLNLGGQAPCYMVIHAAMAIASGLARNVLVFRALNGRSEVRIGSSQFQGPGGQYRYPIGYTAYPQYIAMWARRYMIETGTGYEDLAAVALVQRDYAQKNERAILRKPLTLNEYFASPFIADPFRVVDCTIEVDGACALLITSLPNARLLRQPPAVIHAGAYACGRRSGLDMGDALLWEDYSRNYTSLLASELWASAGMRPRDLDFAEIYDCFSSVVLFGLEGLGLADRGGAGEMIRSGATRLTGELPVNTNGGLLCEGYVHGMNTVAEAALQIQGRCDERQVPSATVGVVTSGALMDGSALVLTAD
jgi:acetyl-CoA acetyltransferase